MTRHEPLVDYCFGLHWFALVDGPSGPGLRRLLRSHPRAWYCLAGGDLLAAGLADEACLRDSAGLASVREASPAANGRRAVSFYSAAACVAGQHPDGCVLALWRLEQGRFWLMAAHDGAVIGGTDCLFDDPAQAHAVHAEMKRRFSGLRELPQPEDLRAHLEQGRQESCRLHAGAGPRSRRFVVLLGPVLALVLIVAGWILGQQRPAVQAAAADLDGLMQDFRQRHWLPGVAGFQSLLGLLERLPYQAAGWRLQQADCLPNDGSWQCAALYARHDPQASNQGLEQILGPRADLQFLDLDRARLRVAARHHGQPLDSARLRGQRQNERDLFSALQAVQGAFGQMSIGPPQALDLDPGAAHVEHAPGVQRRPWRSQSPLRSAYLLLPQAQVLRWEKITLHVAEQAIASLASSVLTLNLEGYVYERADEASSDSAQVLGYDLAPAHAVASPGSVRHGAADHGP